MSFDEWLCFGIPEITVKEATDWIAILDADSVSSEQKQNFNIWLDDKPENRWAFEELAEAWAKTSLLSSLESEINHSQVIEFPHREAVVLAANSAFKKADIETHFSPDSSPLWLSNFAAYTSLVTAIIGILQVF